MKLLFCAKCQDMFTLRLNQTRICAGGGVGVGARVASRKAAGVLGRIKVMSTQPWHATAYADMPDGWAYLTGDADWAGCGAAWSKFLPDGSVLVVRLENMLECMGERDCLRDNVPEFMAQLLFIDLPNVDLPGLDSALSCCGWRFCHYQGEGVSRRFVIEDSYDHELVVPDPIPEGDVCDRQHLVNNDEYQRVQRVVLLDACVSNGTFAVVWSEDSRVRPLSLLKHAREEGALFMRDREPYMSKPVNKIGTTVAQAAKGDLLGGLTDYAKQVMATQEAPDSIKNLMLKMYGQDPDKLAGWETTTYGECVKRENMFSGKGTITNVRTPWGVETVNICEPADMAGQTVWVEHAGMRVYGNAYLTDDISDGVKEFDFAPYKEQPTLEAVKDYGWED